MTYVHGILNVGIDRIYKYRNFCVGINVTIERRYLYE